MFEKTISSFQAKNQVRKQSCVDFWVSPSLRIEDATNRKKTVKTRINSSLTCVLESPSKYPFDIPEPILDSGVETIGSNSTGSDREEAKHQEKVEIAILIENIFHNHQLGKILGKT